MKLGGILPLTGSMGPVGKRISDSAQLAVEHINEGGGVKGCQVEFILRDDQGQPTVGVDAAKYLVDVERVPAITGTVSSGVTLPILTSVGRAVEDSDDQLLLDGGDLHDACAGRQDRRLLLPHAADREDAGLCVSAKVAAERGYKRIAMIYINTDFGTGMVKDFTKAFAKLGGQGRRRRSPTTRTSRPTAPR